MSTDAEKQLHDLQASVNSSDRGSRKRIPMSAPRRKMEVPDIPGYRCYWFLESNVPAALQGWYEFVKTDEISLNQQNVANDSTLSGNTDLGTNISIIGNSAGTNGQPELQYLMKIKEEYFKEDQKSDDDRDAAIMSGIFRKEQIQGSENDTASDRGTRYVKTALFQRPTRKGDK